MSNAESSSELATSTPTGDGSGGVVTTHNVPDNVRDAYKHLPVAERFVAGVGARPAWGVYAACVITALLVWVWLAIMSVVATDLGGTGALGPGMARFGAFAAWLGVDAFVLLEGPFGGVLAALVRLCSPVSGLNSFSIAFGMWAAMSVAMMLPSAAPMLRTYGDIADVAAQKGEKVVSLLVLAAGYLFVWFGFAALAAGFQWLLVEYGLALDATRPLGGLIGGSLLLLAGVYQFSSLKNACLEKCRNPFSTLFGRWSTEPVKVFKLGVEQGIFCLGCCWALMLVMLAVGTMNLAWMAFLTLFTVLEKTGRGDAISRGFGMVLLAWGAIVMFVSIIAAFGLAGVEGF